MTNTITIAKTIVAGSNNYGYSGAISIDIFTTKVRPKITSGIKKEIPYPTTTSNSSTAPANYIVDLRQCIESWEIEGYLDDSDGTTAIVKMEKLLAIKEAGGTVSFTYRDRTFTDAYIYNLFGDDIDFESGDISRAGEAKFKVGLEVRRGKVIGT